MGTNADAGHYLDSFHSFVFNYRDKSGFHFTAGQHVATACLRGVGD